MAPATYLNGTERERINPGYGFVAPASIFFAIMAVFPTLYVIYLSVNCSPRGRPMDLSFCGLSNYADVFTTAAVGPVVLHTLVFSIGSTIFHIFFGLALALYLNSNLNRRFLTLSRALLLTPWAISPAVAAMVWRLLSHPDISPIGYLVSAINPDWSFAPLASVDTALPMLIAINTWHFTPFYMLMILAGLQGISPTLYEISMIDGANVIQRLWYVTLPQIRRLLFTIGLFDIVTTAVYFDLIWITTRGGPAKSTEVLSTFTYTKAFLSFDFGFASALSIILFLVSISLSILVVVLMERE
jgi:multiple sugar transport system permease protein